MDWTPLSGAPFEDVFGPACSRSRVQRRRTSQRAQRKAKRNLKIEHLEEKAIPAVIAGIVTAPFDGMNGSSVGDVVRLRAVAEVASDNIRFDGLTVQAAVPNGLEVCNDGTATIARVSDGAGITSSITDPAADVRGDET